MTNATQTIPSPAAQAAAAKVAAPSPVDKKAAMKAAVAAAAPKANAKAAEVKKASPAPAAPVKTTPPAEKPPAKKAEKAAPPVKVAPPAPAKAAPVSPPNGDILKMFADLVKGIDCGPDVEIVLAFDGVTKDAAAQLKARVKGIGGIAVEVNKSGIDSSLRTVNVWKP